MTLTSTNLLLTLEKKNVCVESLPFLKVYLLVLSSTENPLKETDRALTTFDWCVLFSGDSVRSLS